MKLQTWELLPFWIPQSKKNTFWALLFVTLFGLSIDVWNWDSDNRFSDWIPYWVIYLVFIQLALAYFLWKFSKEWSIDE